MANKKSPEQKMTEIYQEIGFERFRSIVIVLLALNKPKKEKSKREKAVPVAAA